MRSSRNTIRSAPAGLLCNALSFPSPLPSGSPYARPAQIEPEGLRGSPPPLWGRDREGGILQPLPSGFPPPQAPPASCRRRVFDTMGGNPRGGNPRIAALRQALAKLETAAPGAKTQHLPLGVPDMHAHLPGPRGARLRCPARGGRGGSWRPAGGVRLRVRPDGGGAAQRAPGPAVFIASRRALADFGKPLWPRPRPARPRRRPAPPRRDPHRQGRAVGASRTRCAREARPAMVAGAIAGEPRSHHQPPAEPRRRRARHAARPPAHLRRRGHERGRHALAHRRRTGRPRPLRRLRRPALERGAGALPQRPSRTVAHRVESCRASFPSG